MGIITFNAPQPPEFNQVNQLMARSQDQMMKGIDSLRQANNNFQIKVHDVNNDALSRYLRTAKSADQFNSDAYQIGYQNLVDSMKGAYDRDKVNQMYDNRLNQIYNEEKTAYENKQFNLIRDNSDLVNGLITATAKSDYGSVTAIRDKMRELGIDPFTALNVVSQGHKLLSEELGISHLQNQVQGGKIDNASKVVSTNNNGLGTVGTLASNGLVANPYVLNTQGEVTQKPITSTVKTPVPQQLDYSWGGFKSLDDYVTSTANANLTLPQVQGTAGQQATANQANQLNPNWDANKQFTGVGGYNGNAMALRQQAIKRGVFKSNRSIDGGVAHPATYSSLMIFQDALKDNFKWSAAVKDSSPHSGKTSYHHQGLAFDVSLKDYGNGKSERDTHLMANYYRHFGFKVAENKRTNKNGVADYDIFILNEHKHPSKNSTAPHIHVEFRSKEVADRFFQLQSQTGKQ